VLVWLSVWSEVQTCMWPSWCHCHSLSLASVKSRLVLPFWYQLTRVVLDKRPLNGCVCVLLCCSTMQQTNHKRVLDVAFLNSCRRSLSDNNATRCVLYCTTPETTQTLSFSWNWSTFCSYSMFRTHTHTHPFNGPFSGTTQVSRYQNGKINLDFTEARDSEWQWHQLGHMQVCTLFQTDNHASTPPLSFLQAGCPSCRPTTASKHWRHSMFRTLGDN